jgi:hypothetical protein
VPRDEKALSEYESEALQIEPSCPAPQFPHLFYTSPCEHMYSVPNVALPWAAQLWDRRFKHQQGNGQLSLNV